MRSFKFLCIEWRANAINKIRIHFFSQMKAHIDCRFTFESNEDIIDEFILENHLGLSAHI